MTTSLDVLVGLNVEISASNKTNNTKEVKKLTRVLDRYSNSLESLTSQRYIDSFFTITNTPIVLDLNDLGFSSVNLLVIKSNKTISASYKISTTVENTVVGKLICISDLQNNVVIDSNLILTINKLESGAGELELLVAGNLLTTFPTVIP